MDDDEPNWSKILLVGGSAVVFKEKESNYSHFDTLFMAGPINIHPVTCKPVDFIHHCFNTDIMAYSGECKNVVGEHFFASKLKESNGSNMGR